MNTNDSEPNRKTYSFTVVDDYTIIPESVEAARFLDRHCKAYAKRKLKHYRSVRDIREAIGGDEPVNTVSSIASESIEPLFRNELRASIRSSLNLDGGSEFLQQREPCNCGMGCNPMHPPCEDYVSPNQHKEKETE